MTVDEVLDLLTRVASEDHELTDEECESVLDAIAYMVGDVAIVRIKEGQSAITVDRNAWPGHVQISFTDDGERLDDGGALIAGIWCGLRSEPHRSRLIEAARSVLAKDEP